MPMMTPLATGGGGAASAITTPDQIAGIVEWWKADAGAYVDAGVTLCTDTQTVRQWNGQMGNYNLSQSSAGARPAWRSSLGPNSKPAVKFDGAATYMATSLFGSSLTQPYEIWIVFSNVNAILTVYDGLASGGRASLITNMTTGLSIYAGSSVSKNSSFDAGNFGIVAATFNGNSSNLYQGGMQQSVTGIGTNNLGGLTIGMNQPGGFFYSGYIAELFVFNVALSAANRSLMTQYLANKYQF